MSESVEDSQNIQSTPHQPTQIKKTTEKLENYEKNHYKKNQLHIKRDKEYIRKNQMTKVKIGKAL